MARERTIRGNVAQPERCGRNSQNPTTCKEGKGVRNFACSYYDACLDKAAKAMWSGFTCKECQHNQQKEEESLN